MYVRGPNCAWQAIEFTRKLDDGMHPELWSEADQSLATHSDFSHAALVPDLSCCADRGYYSHRPFSCRQNTTSDGAPVDQFRISLVQALSNLRFFLAQRGFKVANYPVIPGEDPPKHLFDPAIQHKCVALTIQAQRLHAVRSARMKDYGREESKYASMENCKKEVNWLKTFYMRQGPHWTVLDTTNGGVEETAAKVLKVLQQLKGVKHATGGMWEWQRELEVLAGRLSRGRADEAAASRRAAEEAERAALQRSQEAERRSLMAQTEESQALQQFLSGWHHSLEARLELFAQQFSHLERRVDQDCAQVEGAERRLEAQSVRFEDFQTSVQTAIKVSVSTTKGSMLARCIPLALALAAAAAEGSLPARQLMRAEFDARTAFPAAAGCDAGTWREVVHAAPQHAASVRTDADGTVRLLDSYIRQVVNASCLAAFSVWRYQSAAVGRHVQLHLESGNLAAMDCSNMVLRNTGLSDLLQGDCVRSKAECGSAYCPNDWVSFEVDYSGQKVCSTRSRADCAHGFEMSGSVGYVCKWNDGDGACYRAGASDEADYPEKFRKCFASLSSLSERLASGHEQFSSEIETKCQEVDAELSKRAAESQQALSEISRRLQDVESHGEAAARGLRALEPFIERVTSRLEDVEQLPPVVDNIRSELSAAGQVLRTAIAAEGKRAEENLQTLREDLYSCQESDRLRLARDLQEVRNLAEASMSLSAGQLPPWRGKLCRMDRRCCWNLLLCLPISVSLEATSLEGSGRREASAAVAISADGAGQGLVRSQRWWAPRAPPDESRPQPLANTGTINPLSCYDTLVKAKIPCINFAKVVCKPWQAEECQCDERNPICVTDAAQRSSPSSPANGRSAIATQYACCPKPAPDEAEKSTKAPMCEAASERAQELDTALASGKEEESRALERLREEAAAANRNIQAVEARLHDLRTGTAANLQGSEQRLQDLFREALHTATDKAFAQDQVVSKRLESELHVQIGAVSAEIKELKSVSMDSSEKLRAVEQEFSTLAEKLERVKGQGISHSWKIPHCLRRLRYLSLLAEPGLWLDSDRFYLGGLGPLEMRLYAKGLRGGYGQCSLALRLPSEAAAKFALPMMVDLTVAGHTTRAGQTTDPEGSDCIIWLAESLGLLEDHLADELADLSLAAELPLLPAPALLAGCASCPTLSPPGTRDDLCTVDDTEEAATDPLVALSSTSRARDVRGVAQVPVRGNEAVSAAGIGAPLPTLLGTTECQPSGVFALRSSWGASCTLPVSKASGPFDEQISPLGSLLGHGQRNPVAIPADDAAR
eukprot:s5373_g2.t1